MPTSHLWEVDGVWEVEGEATSLWVPSFYSHPSFQGSCNLIKGDFPLPMLLYARLPPTFAFISLKASPSSGEVAGSGIQAGKEAKGWPDHRKTGYPADLEPWTTVPTFIGTRRSVSSCPSWADQTSITLNNSLSQFPSGLVGAGV